METENASEETLPAGPAGISQLSLVEHALCPLDPRGLTDGPLRHECRYRYADAEQRMQTARVQIDCLAGLSPADEFYLWGLLALTFEQPSPSFEFHATPYYCLRKLGLIRGDCKGGKSYRLFRESLARLAGVRYRNDRFYDPIRREHRAVGFGFLSYSLPLDPRSSRTWRIVWDPIFFEFCQAAGGQLRFDLATYRALDAASRRLFLLLQKVFWRRDTSPAFELRHLAVDVLGFAPTLSTKELKSKLKRCVKTLSTQGVVAIDHIEEPFEKRAKGAYVVRFRRGPQFRRTRRAAIRPAGETDSPLRDPLRAIGFENREITRILREYSAGQVQVWADVTLAALERKGKSFFRRSPQAFFLDNVRSAATSGRTPPDWFVALRKEEEQPHARRGTGSQQALSAAHLWNDDSPDVAAVVSAMTATFRTAGQSETDAANNARQFAVELSRRRRPK